MTTTTPAMKPISTWTKRVNWRYSSVPSVQNHLHGASNCADTLPCTCNNAAIVVVFAKSGSQQDRLWCVTRGFTLARDHFSVRCARKVLRRRRFCSGMAHAHLESNFCGKTICQGLLIFKVLTWTWMINSRSLFIVKIFSLNSHLNKQRRCSNSTKRLSNIFKRLFIILRWR